MCSILTRIWFRNKIFWYVPHSHPTHLSSLSFSLFLSLYDYIYISSQSIEQTRFVLWQSATINFNNHEADSLVPSQLSMSMYPPYSPSKGFRRCWRLHVKWHETVNSIWSNGSESWRPCRRFAKWRTRPTQHWCSCLALGKPETNRFQNHGSDTFASRENKRLYQLLLTVA